MDFAGAGCQWVESYRAMTFPRRCAEFSEVATSPQVCSHPNFKRAAVHAPYRAMRGAERVTHRCLLVTVERGDAAITFSFASGHQAGDENRSIASGE